MHYPERVRSPSAPSLVVALLLVTAAGCGSDASSALEAAEGAAPSLEGAPIDPPFAVREGEEGLVFTYVDADGAHTVASLAEVPEARREVVRVDSLRIPPERRLDPSKVYVADLRSPGPEGRYPVRVVERDAFEAYVARGAASEGAAASATDAPVVLYGASWCGACRQARRYFQERGIAFVDRDIEREPGARAEMLRKAQAAGVRATGIPIIDFRGTILPGFQPDALDRLIRQGS